MWPFYVYMGLSLPNGALSTPRGPGLRVGERGLGGGLHRLWVAQSSVHRKTFGNCWFGDVFRHQDYFIVVVLAATVVVCSLAGT